MENLLAKYRPLHLADVRGQPDVVRALALFAQDPYPTAFLLHGESGIGKTSTATALANELGCVIDDNELGGFSEIASGEQTKDSVKDKLNYLRYRPLMGSGWRVLVVNEADQMSIAAEGVWLDALEHLTNQTVIIFTTNAPGKLSRRLRDRCEVFGFEWESAKLQPAIQDLARTVWLKEVGHGEPPGLDTLGMPTLGNLDEMRSEERRVGKECTSWCRSRGSPYH